MQRRMLWVALIAAALVVVAFGYGCGEMSAGTCADNGTCASDAMPGSDATAADVETPLDARGTVEGSIVRPDAGDAGDGRSDGGEGGNVGCDPTQDPKDAPCLLDSVYGVFVSATTGQDTGIGTQLQPLKTITEGIAKAAQLGKSRVYVCNGSYGEQVSLDAQHDGIGLYGGFDCGGGWAWDGDGGATQVVGPSALYALRVDATTRSIAIEDMSFTVPDATGHDSTGAGNSSIAAFVSNESAGVNFQRVGLRAGAGAGGSGGGVPPTNLFSANAADLQGNGADGGAGGGTKDCHCKIVGDTIGGAGGAAGDPAGDGGAGSATPLPAPQGIRTGTGGMGFNDSNGMCAPGRLGADGSPQGDGGIGATLGSLSASGWEPGAGTDGSPAYPGQGGGGGGGGQTVGGSAGGCGGCGGAGGLAGHGGGASVALLLFNATASVAESRLVSAAGGAGGSGSVGEGGGSGGGGGAVGACGGGAGGSGPGGQGGGGGAGGVSLGILSNSARPPTVDVLTSFMLGTPGSGGAPGAGGDGGSVSTDHAPAGPPGTMGADGIALQILTQ